MTIAEVVNLPPESPVPEVVGVLSQVGKVISFDSKHDGSPQTYQDFSITDGPVAIPGILVTHAVQIPMTSRGQPVRVSSCKVKNHNGVYKLWVTARAKFEFTGQSAAPAQNQNPAYQPRNGNGNARQRAWQVEYAPPPPPPPPNPSRNPADSVKQITEAAERFGNCYQVAMREAEFQARELKNRNGTIMGDEQLRTFASGLMIWLDKQGLIGTMPSGDIQQFLPASEPPK